MPAKIVLPDTDNLVQRYLAGRSVKQLAAELRVSRAIVTRTLNGLNVPLRGRSAAQFTKWSFIKQDRSWVERCLSKVWEARRGQTVSLGTKMRHAETVARKLLQVTTMEKDIAMHLEYLGVIPSLQRTIGPYNIDIAIDKSRVAVEIQTAYLSGGKSMRPERLNYILDHRWNVLIIFIPKSSGPYVASILAEYIVSFVKRTSSNPSISRQYGVINGKGQPVTCGCPQFNHGSRVPGF